MMPIYIRSYKFLSTMFRLVTGYLSEDASVICITLATESYLGKGI